MSGPVSKAVLAVALCAITGVSAMAFDELDSLPEGEGREETYYTCIACHSFNLITRQGMSRGMWDDTIGLMIERHGMIELEPDEYELILSYLAEHFPPTRPDSGDTGRRGWTNPFAP